MASEHADSREGGPVRFNHLRRDIKGISRMVLSQILKKPERDGLMSRAVFAIVPVTMEYALTPFGRTQSETMQALTRWVEHNMDAVVAPQKAYDAAVAAR